MARPKKTTEGIPPINFTTDAPVNRRVAASAVEEARRAGLLSGDKSAHVSFRVPPQLLEKALRRTGITSPTELGIAALSLLAQVDPFVELMEATRGELAGLPELEV